MSVAWRLFLVSCLPWIAACSSSATDAAYPDQLPPAHEAPEDAEVYALTGATAVVEVDINGMVSYTMTFPDVIGEMALATEEVEQSTAVVTVNMRTGKTDNTELGKIAKSPDFLDVEKYPEARFEIRSLKLFRGKEYELTGVLELHGTKKAVKVPFVIEVDPCQAKASTAFTINRRQFGVESDTMLDSMASDDVEIRVKITVPRKEAPARCNKQE